MFLFLNSKKLYTFLKYLTCSAPLIFCLFIYLTENVNYNDLFELRKYSATTKFWLGQSEQEYSIGRLPVYPIFLTVIYRIFGIDNYNALIFFQAIIGFFSFYFLIKTLEELKISKNLITISTILLNFSMIFRFSVFLPNCIFIFILTILIYNFTKFFITNEKKYFFFFCMSLFLLLLTRPIFQFTILLTIPIVVIYLIKIKVNHKSLLIFVLLSSYVCGIGIQILRHYNYDKSILYTSQSGHHFHWVVACLSKKYACGTRDMSVFNYLAEQSDFKIGKIEGANLEQQNKVRMKVGKEYIINNFNKDAFIFSVIFSYIKVIFHSSLIEIYGALDFNAPELYLSGENNLIYKLKMVFSSSLDNPLNLFWCLSILFIFLLRLIQLYGMLVGIKNRSMRFYILILSSMLIVILITSVGLGNPRYRSEAEPLLVILGAFGINHILTKLKNKN